MKYYRQKNLSHKKTAILFVVLQAVLVFSTAYTQVAFCEDTQGDMERGRLKDGRAFRKGDSGYQITDHIAELEVTVDDLKRQVRALEDEVTDKRQEIASLKGAQGDTQSKCTPCPSIKEETMFSTPSKQKPQAKPLPCPVCDTSSLERDIRLLETKLANAASKNDQRAASSETESLKRQIQAEKDLQQSARIEITAVQGQLRASQEQVQQLETSITNLNAQKQTLSEDLSAIKKELAVVSQGQDQTTELSKLRTQQEERLKLLKEDLAQARADLEKANRSQTQEQRDLKADLLAQKEISANERSEKEAMRSQLLRTQQELASLSQAARSSETQNQDLTKSTPAPSTSRAATSAQARQSSQSEDLMRAEASIKTKLASISSLISQRKSLIDAQREKGAGVSIRIQSLATEKGESLDSLRTRTAKLSSVSDAAEIFIGVKEIEDKLIEDIKVLKRLSSL